MNNVARPEFQRRVNEKLTGELGPNVREWLADPTVIEIILNPSGELWVERLGEEMEQRGTMSASQARSMMGTIASTLNQELTEKNPAISCELSDEFAGARFQGVIPPIVKGPAFTIRKKAIAVFTLHDYVEQGIMTQAQREVIEAAVRNRQNILIAGGTGSGKTTLTNAVVRYIADVSPNDRIVTLEDTRELQCEVKNKLSMYTSPQVNMTLLLKDTLRHRPDRILVGEVRDGAALDLLMAWNTGHPGVCTLHANSAQAALTRLELMIAMVSVGPMQRMIAEAVNLIVYIEKYAGSRRIKEVVQVTGYDGKNYVTQSIGESDV